MHISHSPDIWSLYPELVPGVVVARGLAPAPDVQAHVQRFHAIAQSRLAAVATESELTEIQAWRRAFSRMGLKPTQYRCASESLLRRFKKEGSLPAIHPLIDVCNAASLAYAIPVAVFDTAMIAQGLQVRPAQGSERYLGFSGETEHPEPGEVVFADAQGNAHARRWTHRQSALSAVTEGTRDVLVVAEALHPGAAADVQRLTAELAQVLAQCGASSPQVRLLTAHAPRLDF